MLGMRNLYEVAAVSFMIYLGKNIELKRQHFQQVPDDIIDSLLNDNTSVDSITGASGSDGVVTSDIHPLYSIRRLYQTIHKGAGQTQMLACSVMQALLWRMRTCAMFPGCKTTTTRIQ